MTISPNFLTITEALESIADGTLPPHAPAEACRRQIESLNPVLNAFIEIIPPQEMGTHSSRSGNEARALTHIPLAIKDLVDVAGIPTRAGSPNFFGQESARDDALVVHKLRSAGAHLIGKTHTHEIALGITGINSHFGPVRNPWDPGRITGGSSSGSAAAVAAGMCLGALGSDTGGSIRIPAGLCGTVGLKPTYGRVSLRGVVPLSWNMDHIGPITRSVKDAALLLEVLAGYDPLDPVSADRPAGEYLPGIDSGIAGWKVALGVGEYIERSEPEVLEAFRGAALVFSDLGARVIEVVPPDLREAAAANGKMVIADAAAFHRERLNDNPGGFGPDVRERLEAGRAVTSTEYSLARRVQSEMKHAFARFFDEYDVLLLPTTAVTAPPIENMDSAAYAPKLTRFTAPFNLTGLPALSLPCGFSPQGLPVGLQIVGKAWDEKKVLQAGFAYEEASGWSTKRPGF